MSGAATSEDLAQRELNAAKVHAAAGREEDAVASLRRALDLAPSTSPLAMKAHERLAERLCERPEGLPHLRLVCQANPDASKPWMRLARLLKTVGESEEEAAAWEHVLTLQPDEPQAHVRLAVLLENQPAALPHLRVLADAAPAELKPWVRLARAFKRIGDKKEEIKAWRRVLAIRPDELEAHARLVELLPLRPAAAPHLRALVEARPDDVKAWRRLARVLQIGADSLGAVEAWRRVLELGSDSLDVHESLARLLCALHRKEEASPHLAVVAMVDAEHPKIQERLVRYLREAADKVSPALRRRGARSAVVEETQRILDFLRFSERLAPSSAQGASALAQATFTVVVEHLAAIIRTAQTADPAGVAERWSAVMRVYSDPRFIELAADFPSVIDHFVRTSGIRGPNMDVLTADALLLSLPRTKKALAPRTALLRQIANEGSFEEVERRAQQVLASPAFASPVLICGFHHSGTRLLARILEAAGVFQQVNTFTHEWTYVQNLNTVLLPGWVDVRAIERFSRGWDHAVLSPERIGFRLAAVGYDGAGAWGHKDPRSCVTAEAWIGAFPKLRIVNIIRNPLDVLGTLPAARYARFTPRGAKPQRAVNFWAPLWRVYLEQTRRAAKMAWKSTEVRFEDLCVDPVGVTQTILSDLALPSDGLALDVEALGIDRTKVGEYRTWAARADISKRQLAILEQLSSDYGYGETAA